MREVTNRRARRERGVLQLYVGVRCLQPRVINCAGVNVCVCAKVCKSGLNHYSRFLFLLIGR